MGAKKTFERPSEKVAANRPKMSRNRVQGDVKVFSKQKMPIFTPTEPIIVQNSAILGQIRCFRPFFDLLMRHPESANFKNQTRVSEGLDGYVSGSRPPIWHINILLTLQQP